jgi:predicted AAA+ superfamily ATPase
MQLDAAVERSTVTILKGLPRVGRSSFLDDWVDQRTDAILCQRLEDVRLEPGIFILDHVNGRDIDEIIRIVRAAEEMKSRTRLVVAPNDLYAAEELRTGFPGMAESVEIAPLRLEEHAAIFGQYQLAAGPDQVAQLAATPAPIPAADPNLHWLRGGFPNSLIAEDNEKSLWWRRRMLDGLLARDYTRWGVERSFPLADLWDWLSSRNSEELDENGSGFGTRQELRSAIYVLELVGLIRRLPNYAGRSSNDLKQKIFVRDTGLLHASLGIETSLQLRANQAFGGSFESYATEALILAAGGRCDPYFYRKMGNNGADEIDLILKFPSQVGGLVAIEFKVNPNEKVKRGFYNVCESLKIEDSFVVHSGETATLNEPVQRLDLRSAIARIAKFPPTG